MGERILVTGGAGYIGAHACKALKRAGYIPVAFDNLSTGWAAAVKFGPLFKGDLLDRKSVDDAISQWKPVAVMHFAALSLVGESMFDPGKYWRMNINGAANLIEATIAANIRKFVFSSTCATYGDQDGVLLREDTPQHPINAYGASKLAIEQMLANFNASHGLNSVIFRYFNVAGADPDGEVGEKHEPETHLIPLLLDAIQGKRSALTLHGTDYPTSDGTCVRDYVHVSDLVDAHVRGLNWLAAGNGNRTFCLGSGRGYSVREVIDHAKLITNRSVPLKLGSRRAGDAASLVCGSERATKELDWFPALGLEEMIRDAWNWSQGDAIRTFL